MAQVIGSGHTTAAPDTAPAAVIGTASGGLDTGDYRYVVTYITSFGETTPSSASNTLASPGGKSAIVTIPVSTQAGVTGRKLYRTAVDGATYSLAKVINDNRTTSVVDTLADEDLIDEAPPATNTAMAGQIIKGAVSFDGVIGLNVASVVAGATPTPIGHNSYVFVDVATDEHGVILPVLNETLAGATVIMHNIAEENTLKVYPAAGQVINGGDPNDPVDHAAGLIKVYKAISDSEWVQHPRLT